MTDKSRGDLLGQSSPETVRIRVASLSLILGPQLRQYRERSAAVYHGDPNLRANSTEKATAQELFGRGPKL